MKDIFGKAYLYLRTLFVQLFTRSIVVKMSAFFDYSGNLRRENWGDDINWWFLREIADGNIVSFDWSLLTRCFHRPYVMGIGSLLTLVPLDNSIIWGSGVMSAIAPFKGRPKEVRAVRGPLSRKRLLDAGIDCPPIYGDPALLLPMYYKPSFEKKYKLGIIPHYKDFDNPVFDKFKNEPNVIVIKTRDYGKWLEFINLICQCEGIASTSLHGLIVSEAYGIPNLWIKKERKDNSDDIKYHDFFLSIGIDRQPYTLCKTTSDKDLFDALRGYKKGHLDLNPLLLACPIKLKIGNLRSSC